MRVPVLGAYPVSSGSYKNIILPIARRNALPHLNIPIDEKVTAGSFSPGLRYRWCLLRFFVALLDASEENRQDV